MDAKTQLQKLGFDVLGYEPEELRLERFRRDAHREIWEQFILNSANGNLFQTRRFLEYHPENRFEDHSLLFWRGNQLVAVAGGEVTDMVWSGHRFTSHGGIAVRPNLSASEALDVVYALLAYANAQGWNRLTMRFLPDILAEHSFITLIWALSVFGFSQDSREMAWCVLPDFSSEEDLLKAYDDSARRSVMKAQNQGLISHESDDFESFWGLLEKNLSDRYNVNPTHSLAEIQLVNKLCPGALHMHGVYNVEGQLIAGSVIFDVSLNGSHCFYFAQDYRFQGIRPMPLLMHHINVKYVVKHRRKLNYGVITASGGHELNLGLSRFKSNFAALPSIRRRFTWEKNQ